VEKAVVVPVLDRRLLKVHLLTFVFLMMKSWLGHTLLKVPLTLGVGARLASHGLLAGATTTSAVVVQRL
jgi:hypothetical protein